MTPKGWILPAAALAAGLAWSGVAQPGARADGVAPAEPVVVELFTAQGCAGCPEANQVVEALADRPGVIALTWPVDYWDYLGWRDTLARPEFTQRQQAYRQALRLRAVATPQVIIDGRRSALATQADALRRAVDEEAERRIFPPELEFRTTGRQVGVGSGRAPSGGADVLAVVFAPGTQVVRVQAGDNRGKSVRHVNVVKRIQRLGAWTGRPALYATPRLRGGEQVAVLVQSRADRRILNAAVR